MKNNKSKLSCKRGFTRNCHAELVSASTPYRAEALNKDTFRVPLCSGFTLIELLVVVLIIGILAAVAVPQYKLAVAKTRYMEMIALGESIFRAERIYYLENGTYTDEISKLPIKMPSVNGITIKVGEASSPYTSYVSVKRNNMPEYIRYFQFNNFKRMCRVPLFDTQLEFLKKVCAKVTGNVGTKIGEHWESVFNK